MNGEKHTLVAKHLANTGTVDITLNKVNFNKTGISFKNTASVFPITLIDKENSGVEATVDFD